MSDLHEKIKKQIEFYFGDSNFPRDKFLRAAAAQNEEGYVSLSTLLTFKKLKELSEDTEVIISAIKDSDIVQANEDKKSIKRRTPLPESDTSNDRTIYAKGFVPGTSIDDISAKFAHIGKVVCVRIRKFQDKKPKPSAFIEFSTVEEAQKALKEKIQVDGKDLELLSKSDFNEQKKQEKASKSNKRKESEDGKEETKGEEGGKKKQKKDRDSKDKEEKRYPSGVFLSFKDIGPDVDREIIKAVFGAFGSPVAFVDFQRGELEGVARFETAEAAKKVLDGMVEQKKELGSKIPTLTILEGEAEEAHYQKVRETQNARFNNKKGKGGKKRQRF